MAAQPICNRQVGGFESPPGLHCGSYENRNGMAVEDGCCDKMVCCAGIGERSNPADCKSAALCFVGSNPTPCTKLRQVLRDNGFRPHRMGASVPT